MNLPVRIDAALPALPVISIDGAWQAPGLNLSHWPGNRTPEPLRHDLSTGSALAFARLDPHERERLAAGCTEIRNNHYDTDGTTCAFAVRQPKLALAHAEGLLACARAGDFFEFASERAVAIDAAITGLADPQLSPLGAELAGLDDRARWQLATDHWMEHLPAALEGGLEPYRDLWEPRLERLARDRSQLERCRRDDLVHLDWTVWTAPTEFGAQGFDPGRHALLGFERADRVLVLSPVGGGTTFRLILSTLSWFDLTTRSALPRPDLDSLAATLNEREGTLPTDELAWRSQSLAGASPELWFGRVGHPLYAEHGGAALAPSALDPHAVRALIADELREKLVAALS